MVIDGVAATCKIKMRLPKATWNFWMNDMWRKTGLEFYFFFKKELFWFKVKFFIKKKKTFHERTLFGFLFLKNSLIYLCFK